MKVDPHTVKKQWFCPELIIIASTEIENKSQANYNEKTFISSRPLPSDPAFNQLFFQKAPGGGVVGFATENAYMS